MFIIRSSQCDPVLFHGRSELLYPSDGWFFMIVDLVIIFAKSGDNGLIFSPRQLPLVGGVFLEPIAFFLIPIILLLFFTDSLLPTEGARWQISSLLERHPSSVVCLQSIVIFLKLSWFLLRVIGLFLLCSIKCELKNDHSGLTVFQE